MAHRQQLLLLLLILPCPGWPRCGSVRVGTDGWIKVDRPHPWDGRDQPVFRDTYPKQKRAEGPRLKEPTKQLGLTDGC